jgi:hypothetical protein
MGRPQEQLSQSQPQLIPETRQLHEQHDEINADLVWHAAMMRRHPSEISVQSSSSGSASTNTSFVDSKIHSCNSGSNGWTCLETKETNCIRCVSTFLILCRRQFRFRDASQPQGKDFDMAHPGGSPLQNLLGLVHCLSILYRGVQCPFEYSGSIL